MKNDYTHISVVLDRSGSMDLVREDTIGGFHAFLDGQKKVPGHCTFTLTQFDHAYDVLHANEPIKQVNPLTKDTFVPRGSTALLDAVGKTIESTGEYLKGLPEYQRPAKVI